jgi:hypothetical protein
MGETPVFTVQQANRTLPLVRRIVEDLVRYHARWQEMVATFESLAAHRNEQTMLQAEALQDDIQRTAAAMDGFLRELEVIGVQFKGFDLGLVDFPGRLNNRDVLLCWKLGEPAVEHWHDVDAGFAGRRRMTPEDAG